MLKVKPETRGNMGMKIAVKPWSIERNVHRACSMQRCNVTCKCLDVNYADPFVLPDPLPNVLC